MEINGKRSGGIVSQSGPMGHPKTERPLIKMSAQQKITYHMRKPTSMRENQQIEHVEELAR